jgi:WD40 repeat protein
MDPRIHVWDVIQREKRFVLLGHAGPVAAMAFSPDGEFLVSGSRDKSCRVWNYTEEPIGNGFVEMMEGLVVCPSPMGRFLLALNWENDGTDRLREGVIFDMKLGHHRRLAAPEALRKPWGQATTYTRPALAPDGENVIVCMRDEAIGLWDLRENRITPIISTGPNLAHYTFFSRSGKFFASRRTDGTITVYDFEKRIPVSSIEVLPGYAPMHLKGRGSFGADDGNLIVPMEGALGVYDTMTGEPIRGADGRTMILEDEHITSDSEVTVSPDGSMLAVSGSHNRLTLFHAHTLEVIRDFPFDNPGFPGSVAAFSGDSRRIFILDKGFRISVRDVSTGRQLLLLDPVSRRNQMLSCEPETGTLAMIGSFEGSPSQLLMMRVPSFSELEEAERR